MVELKRTLKDDGVWIQYDKDSKLKIVNPTSRKAQHQMAELFTIKEMQLMEEGEDAMLEYYSDLPAIELAQKEAKLAAFCVVDWEGFTLDGKEWPFFIDDLIDWLLFDKDAKLFIFAEIGKLRDTGQKKKKKAVKKKLTK